jgi:hypothetical protein
MEVLLERYSDYGKYYELEELSGDIAYHNPEMAEYQAVQSAFNMLEGGLA